MSIKMFPLLATDTGNGPGMLSHLIQISFLFFSFCLFTFPRAAPAALKKTKKKKPQKTKKPFPVVSEPKVGPRAHAQ